MGNDLEKHPFQHGIFCEEEAKPGETRILRNPSIIGKPLGYNVYKEITEKTLTEIFEHTAAKLANRNLLGARKRISETEYGDFEFRTFKQTKEEVDKLAASFVKLNLAPKKYVKEHDKDFKIVGILSRCRPEWAISELACFKNSITIAGIVDLKALPPIENHTELETLFLEEENLENVINLKKEGQLKFVKNLVTFHSFCFEANAIKKLINQAKEVNIQVFNYDELVSIGASAIAEAKNKFPFDLPNENTYCLFIYTSGTTGESKAAMLKHKNLIADIDAQISIGPRFDENDVFLSFLPLAHIYNQHFVIGSFYFGYCVGFCPDVRNILDEMEELKPTFMIGVPRIYERIINYIDNRVKTFDPFKQKLFHEALKVKLYYQKKFGYVHHWLFDRLIFDEFTAKMGGRLKWGTVGGAPIPVDLLKKIRVCFCCPVCVGYGMSETACTSCLVSSKCNSLGTIGGPHGSIEIKLVDVPALGYTTKDVSETTGHVVPRGELCIRGPTIFDGYFKSVEQTKKLIDSDGWFHTGDICLINTDFGNRIQIIDRVKNVFKLSQGEFVIPEKIQNILKKSKYVDQIFVTGKSDRNYLVGIIVPKKDECFSFLKIKEDNEDKIFNENENKSMNEEVLNDLIKIGRENGLKGYELVKKLYLSKEPFSEQNGLLTATSKMKTNDLKKYFQTQIDKMYQ